MLLTNLKNAIEHLNEAQYLIQSVRDELIECRDDDCGFEDIDALDNAAEYDIEDILNVVAEIYEKYKA